LLLAAGADAGLRVWRFAAGGSFVPDAGLRSCTLAGADTKQTFRVV
jgi:hypothetical protein